MEKSILEINNLSYAYDKTKVLDNVAFQCNRGEVLVIAGPNGSGKTTLIKLLFGVLDNKKGSIKIFGSDNTDISHKKKMYYLSSENILPQFLTGDEYVRMMCRLYDIKIDEEKYKKLISYYAMEHRINHLIENYSHGMVKKIQLITAFILQSEITVVDETLNGIDIEAKEVSKILFRKLAEKDKLVIMCTHDLELAEKLGNRAILLYKGTVKDIVNLKEKDCNLTEIFKNLVGFKESDYEI